MDKEIEITPEIVNEYVRAMSKAEIAFIMNKFNNGNKISPEDIKEFHNKLTIKLQEIHGGKINP